MANKKKPELENYKVRMCLTLHDCAICALLIRIGDNYHDGGYGKRAHVECVRDEKRRERVENSR